MFSLSLGAGLRLTPRTGAARRGGAFAYSRLLHPLLYSDTQHVRPRFRVRRRCERQRTGHKHHGRQELGRRCQPRAVAGGLASAADSSSGAMAAAARAAHIVAEVGRQLGQQRWPHAAAPRAAALTCVGGGNVGERGVELCSAGGAQPKLSTSAANAADTLPCDAGGPRRRGPRQRTVCKRRFGRMRAQLPLSSIHHCASCDGVRMDAATAPLLAAGSVVMP